MKKSLVVMALCAAFTLALSTNAFAQKLVACGEAAVSAMLLQNSDTLNDVPKGGCDVSISDFDLYECDADGNLVIKDTSWAFRATSFGTQINLALLDCQKSAVKCSICVEYDLGCGACNLEIVSTDCLGNWHNSPPHPYCEE
jgi:hypothetical protein